MKLIASFSFIFIILSTWDSFSQNLHTWEVYTLKFNANGQYDNPYATIPVSGGNDLLKVEFTGVSGNAEGKSISITGCWNDGKEWIVNFAPPYSGEWKYLSISPDKGLDARQGTLTVQDWTENELTSNPVRRGHVRVKQDGKHPDHFFNYADGRPVLWIGDTWWNWTKRSIHFETFQKLVDDRAGKGFNVGQLFVPGNGWSDESSLLKDNYDLLDPAHVRKVERMIRYANSKGITVWIHAWWSRENIDDTIGEEKIKRWWKYLIHRFGAYNVIWVLAGEYNMFNYGGFPLDFWKELGQFIKNEDPYERIVSAHNTPPFWRGGADGPQWSTGEVMHNVPWLDYNQSQSGHGRYANEMIPIIIAENYNFQPAKPVVTTEPWYEFVEGNPSGKDVRLAAWGAILSGAAGHTYGGGHVWRAHVPESPGEEGAWPLEIDFDRSTYDYEGAASMGILSGFFSRVEWWKMAPQPELISDYPQPFCLANPGEEYVIYLRYGGYLQLDLRNYEGEFVYSFMDPSTGQLYPEETIKGGKMVPFRCPEMYPGFKEFKDWVLWVRRN